MTVHGNEEEKEKDQEQQLPIRQKANGIVGRKEQAIMDDNGHRCEQGNRDKARERRQATAILGTGRLT